MRRSDNVSSMTKLLDIKLDLVITEKLDCLCHLLIWYLYGVLTTKVGNCARTSTEENKATV